jgi:hypothetical protein
MAYELSSSNLIKYFERRLDQVFRQAGQTTRSLTAKQTEDKKGLILETITGNSAVIFPSFTHYKSKSDRIRIVLDPDIKGVDEKDVRKFFENYVENDLIYEKGQALYSLEREKEVIKWRGFLQRVPTKNSSLVCSVIDDEVSTDLLRKGIYGYMFRPIMYFLFHPCESKQ